MGFLYLLSLLVLLLVTSFGQICCSEAKSETHHWFVEGNKTSDALLSKRRVLEYDTKDQDVFSKIRGKERIFEEQLEGLIRAILENGIPDLNIPPLDPLVYKDTVYISETDMPGMMTIEFFELGNFGVFGLSKFINHLMVFDLNQLAITLNFTFPIVVEANHSNFSIIVGDLIPFNGEGKANLIADLRIEAYIGLGRTVDNYIYLDALSADIFFDSLEVEFSTLMGVTGGKETHIFNKLIGDVTPELIDIMKPYMIDGILESLLTSANELLLPLKISYTDIINCLMGSDKCPFDLP